MKVGDLVQWREDGRYTKDANRKWGIGLVIEVYNDHDDVRMRDVEIMYTKIRTSRTIRQCMLEVVST